MIQNHSLNTILELASTLGATIPKELQKKFTDWTDTANKLNRYKTSTPDPAATITLAIQEGRDPSTCPEVQAAITAVEVNRIIGLRGFEEHNQHQLTATVRENFDTLVTAFKPACNALAQTIVTAHAELNGVHPDEVRAADVNAATASTAHNEALALNTLGRLYSALNVIEYQTDSRAGDTNATKLRYYDANNHSAATLRNIDTSSPWAAVTAGCTPSLATNTELERRAEYSHKLDATQRRQADVEAASNRPNYTVLL